MENIRFNRKALAEVYQVLLMLPKDKFNKIPKEIFDGIKNNMDKEYEVDINEIEKEMLPDTQKILATIYTYYLSTLEEKKTIFQMMELEKKQKYGDKELFKGKSNQEQVESKEKLEMVPIKENVITKIVNWIRRLFKR